MTSLKIGDIQVTPAVEVQVRFKAEVLLPEASDEGIARHRDWLAPRFMDDSGLLILNIQTFVVKTRHHTIVVDTCFGNDKKRRPGTAGHMRYGPYLQDLAAAGANPEMVDFVLCTHLHGDHVGWNTRLQNGRWAPTFPRAKYLFGRKDWEFFQKEKEGGFGRESLEDSVRPIVEAGLAVFVDGEHGIEDGVRIEPLPGHTPGHVSLRLTSRGREAIMTGDMMHHPVQVAEPQWSSVACYDAAHSRATRTAFVERYAGTDVIVMPAHFPVPGGGHIVKTREGFRFKA